MNEIEKNRISMYENVITYLLENSDIISGNRSLSYGISKLREAIDEIKLKDRMLTANNLEKIIIANKSKDDLISALLPISNSLFIYAGKTGDLLLKLKCRLSQSLLYRITDAELYNKCSAIKQFALMKLPNLYKYGITKNVIQELGNKIEAFKNAQIEKSISLITDRSDNVLSNSHLEIEKILVNQLDKVVEQYCDDYTEFYNDYLAVRSGEMLDEYEAESEELELEEQ
jgi:hypothetical protein